MRNNLFSVIILLTLLFSCKTRQQQENTLNYMQNIEEVATEVALKNNLSTIQKGDQLVIFVSAKDMDVVKPYNQNYSSSEVVIQTQAGGNAVSGGQQPITGPTYIVDSEGNIDFSGVGTINTTGKSLMELKDELRDRIKKYVINPTVSIRLVNFKITVLGEVNKPGPYIIADGQATLLNALGLAGELTMYGKRDDILIVRTENDEISKQRINIKDASFITSPYYHLKQGDVIYVSSNETKEKTSRLDPNTGIYLSIAGVAIAAAGIIVSLLRN